MSPRPKIKLSRLREIGWTLWDPFGLAGYEDRPEDEYDDYLLQAAGRIWNGVSEDEVAEYLAGMESEMGGPSHGPEDSARAREVVRALSAYMSELRAGRRQI